MERASERTNERNNARSHGTSLQHVGHEIKKKNTAVTCDTIYTWGVPHDQKKTLVSKKHKEKRAAFCKARKKQKKNHCGVGVWFQFWEKGIGQHAIKPIPNPWPPCPNIVRHKKKNSGKYFFLGGGKCRPYYSSYEYVLVMFR